MHLTLAFLYISETTAERRKTAKNCFMIFWKAAEQESFRKVGGDIIYKTR